MPTITCQRCGKPFQARSGRARYCHGACYCANERAQGRKRAARYTDTRRRAVILTASAIQRGELVRQPCEVCGSKRSIVAHHDDYSKPLEVRWLCRSDHRRWHAANGSALHAYQQGAA